MCTYTSFTLAGVANPVLPADCTDVLKRQETPASGIYVITVGNITTNIFCDMATRGGGWSVRALF